MTTNSLASEEQADAATGKTRSLLSGAVPWVLAGVVVLAFSGFGRPLWLDEVLHFALGNMSFVEALRTIDYTTIEINHGQTGVYMLVDWLLLQVFGASAWALRLPSTIYGFVLLASAVTIMRTRGFGIVWQSLAVVGFTGTFFLMTYIGEARPYMPLAGSAVAMLAYFLIRPQDRGHPWPRTLAVFGIVLGATMQAYWPLYLMAALIGALFVHTLDGNRFWASWRGLRAFVAFPYLIPAFVLFIALGQATWMRWPREFTYDPFQWFGSPQVAAETFLDDHLVRGLSPWVWVVLGSATIVAVFLLRRRAIPLLGPLIIFLGALLSSVVVSWLSVSRGYWIFERQWVAGIALATIALVWFFAELWRLSWRGHVIGWVTSAAFGLVLVLTAGQSVQALVDENRGWAAQQQRIATDARTPEEIFQGASEQAVVEAANVNVARGGPVWPEFTLWYAQQAGMREDFRGRHPNWSDLLENRLGVSFDRL